MEVQFDPGFVQHMKAFIPSIKHVYMSIAHYRKFNQKRMQFKMRYPILKSLVENYIGFYLGCMLWAMYIKQFDNADILNKLCYGGEYDEKETLAEVNSVMVFLEKLRKDAKFFINEDYMADDWDLRILDAYREFLSLNRGFVQTKTTNDIKAKIGRASCRERV